MLGGTAFLVAELVALFFGVSFAIELLQRRIGPERLKAWMGGRPAVAALKGIAIGFLTPFCTYSAIPMLVGMRQAQVPVAGYVAFAVAAPVLDPILFGALVLIVGLKVAIIYLTVAFSAAISLALMAQRVGIERHLKPISSFTSPGRVTVATPVLVTTTGAPIDSDPNPDSPRSEVEGGCGDNCTLPWRGFRVESRHAARAATRLLRSVGLLLGVGVAVGLAIEAFAPPETAAEITGSNPMISIPVAAALGTPLYFHTELFVPIAHSLNSAGVGIGAIVALTIAGAGANVPEFIILTRLAHSRLIAVFFGYIFAVAVAGGVLAQAIAG
jgi:uncharacterized membrane protein YraQ (UPF0718 family)